MKKLFGGLNITWKKIIISAILIGIYTAVMAILPITKDKSFRDISISYEVWVLFGILIITNSKSAKESALKCFVFFLISQPLIYLIQVPFSWLYWELFKYYRFWFGFTVLTIPMGYIGYYMRKNKWWGLFILTPILILLSYHYYGYLSEAVSFFPNHLLSAVFTGSTMLIYAWFIFDDKKLRIIETIIAVITIVVLSVLVIAKPKSKYHIQLTVEGIELKENTKVWLEDEKFGKLNIKYEEDAQDYLIDAEFTNTGDTKIHVQNDDKTCVANIKIQRNSYSVTDIECD